MVSIAFGQKIPRPRPLRNPALSRDQRDFDGEFVVFVKHTAWRLVDGDAIICTSDDSNEPDGPMVSGLQRLVGNSLTSVRVINDTGGLKLAFGERLSIELDGVGCAGDLQGYSLFHLGDTIAGVGCKN